MQTLTNVRFAGIEELDKALKAAGVQLQINFGSPQHHLSTMWYGSVVDALAVVGRGYKNLK